MEAARDAGDGTRKVQQFPLDDGLSISEEAFNPKTIMITQIGEFGIRLTINRDESGGCRYEAVVTDVGERMHKRIVTPFLNQEENERAFFIIRDLVAEAISSWKCVNHPKYEAQPDGTCKLILP